MKRTLPQSAPVGTPIGPPRRCDSCRQSHPVGTSCAGGAFPWGDRKVAIHAGGGPPGRAAVGIAISDDVAFSVWSDFQRWQVDDAIKRIAERRAEFTTDAVWALLGEDFPVSKGMTGRLTHAVSQKWIERTDRMVTSQRVGEHGHGQRLTVWRSLIYQPRG